MPAWKTILKQIDCPKTSPDSRVVKSVANPKVSSDYEQQLDLEPQFDFGAQAGWQAGAQPPATVFRVARSSFFITILHLLFTKETGAPASK